MTRRLLIGTLLAVWVYSPAGAAPAVVRTSEDLKGRAYATVWGEGFVEGKTTVKIAPQTRTWDQVRAKASLEQGVDLGSLPARPVADARQVIPKRVRPDLMLIEYAFPAMPTPTVLWVEADGEASTGWVINRPQLWWLSTDRAAPGERVRGFGRNLLGQQPQTAPHIFLKREGEPAITCPFAGGGIDGNITDDAVSLTYETSFAIPKDTAAGKYAVWFHGGMGEQHGWSHPVDLEVAAAEPEPALKVDAVAHGVQADGFTDDTLAIHAAIKEAYRAGGGTVILPAGTLLISNTIALPPKVSLQGAGMDNTVLRMCPGKKFQGLLDVDLVPKNEAAQGYVPYWRNNFQLMLWVRTQSRLADLCVDLDGFPAGVAGCGVLVANGKEEAQDMVFERLATRAHVRERKIAPGGGWMPDVRGAQCFSVMRRTRVSGCQNFGLGVMYGAKAWYCQSLRNFNGGFGGAQAQYVLFEENVSQNIYGRRGFCGGGQYEAYFRNRVEETWLMVGGGEQYLHEGGGVKPYRVTGASARTIAVKDPPAKGAPGWWRVDDVAVLIARGKGCWQTRRVVGFQDGVYQLDRPWDVVPDETSLAMVGPIQCRSLWVRNYSGGGCNSLSLYSTNVEQIVAGHEFHNSGIVMNHGHYDKITCVYFNEFRDCRVVGGEGMESMALIFFDPSKPPDRLPYPVLAGCEWRGNQLEETVFLYGGNPWNDARWIEFHSQGAIMVHSSRRGLVFDGDFQYGHLITGNTIRRARGGSGIFVDGDTSNVYVVGNHIEGCATPVSHYGRDRYVESN